MELKPGNVRDSGLPERHHSLFRCHRCFTLMFNFFKKYHMEKVKDWKWIVFITFLASVLSLGGNFIFRSCANQADTVNKSASIEYVDKKETSIKGYIDTQDNAIITDAADKCNITNARMDRMQAQITGKADKDDFDKLWNLAIKNNDILMQIAIKNGIKVTE
jgi:hypothetical protein